jgi:type IV secretory pathway VirB4 component
MAIQSTQDLVQISDIKEEMIILKNGSLRSVIEVSSINFELRSEEEQMAILQNFQRFLNSVDFPLQIVISSKKIVIDDYIEYVQKTTESMDELMKIQAAEYTRFIKELSTLANIMTKKFYVVVPFFLVADAQKSGIGQSIKSILRPATKSSQLLPEQLTEYRNQVLQRTELILDGLITLGLRAKILKEDELTNLFYSFYNPDSQTQLTTPDGK